MYENLDTVIALGVQSWVPAFGRSNDQNWSQDLSWKDNQNFVPSLLLRNISMHFSVQCAA